MAIEGSNVAVSVAAPESTRVATREEDVSNETRWRKAPLKPVDMIY